MEPQEHVFHIRRATLEDAAEMASMRVASALERHPETDEARRDYERDCAAFFARELARPDSFLRCWVAEAGGRVAGGASLAIAPTLPRFGAAFGGFDGRVRDVYVVTGERRRGIARALMNAVLAEAGRLGLDRLTLGASQMGSGLYLKLGFEYKTDEMYFVRALP